MVFHILDAHGMTDVPEALNEIVDKVLAYTPKPKIKTAKKRKRR